jgi:hypothetical protein
LTPKVTERPEKVPNEKLVTKAGLCGGERYGRGARKRFN